jgi:prephenate dehydrogenase
MQGASASYMAQNNLKPKSTACSIGTEKGVNKMPKKVLVIGLGLIGGSVAVAIKNGNEDIEVYGYDLDNTQGELAKALGVIDYSINNYEEQLHKMDYIVIATPVIQAERILQQLLNAELKQGVIITDVGSTKQLIMAYTTRFLEKNVVVIGGHPMAGSHKSGVMAANDHLFENAIYILTAEPTTPKEKIEELKKLLKATKANFIEMSASLHDEMVGLISHFPHMIASSLVRLVKNSSFEDEDIRRLAAGGFRDITRIASSNPVMWRDIFFQNQKALLGLMESWQLEMDAVKKMIEQRSTDELYNYFHEAKTYRDELPKKKKGAIPAFFDIYVDVKDEPGVIANITNILAENKINLTNIRIIETREDIMGVLRLSFRSYEDSGLAIEILTKHEYSCYQLDEGQ